MTEHNKTRQPVVESFVHQVSEYLPHPQRNEIVDDLRQSIYEELDAVTTSNELPSQADVLAVLGRFGHPLKVASAYLPQRYVIGPQLFPVYTRLLRTFATLAIVALVVVALIMGLTGSWQLSPWKVMGLGFEILLWVFVVVTALCAAIEYGDHKLNWYDNWNPEDIGKSVLGPINRSDVYTNLISEGVFLLWWNEILVLQNSLPEGVLVLELSGHWDLLSVPLNIVFAACFVLHAYALIAGSWRRLAIITEIGLYTLIVVMGGVLLLSSPLVLTGGELTEHVGFADDR